jgi:23S rRNA (adenine2503-C2)-methyltransferase
MIHTTGRINIIGRERAELERLFVLFGSKPYHAGQVMRWIYHRGCTDFRDMTDLSKSLRAFLEKKAEIAIPAVERMASSRDDSVKLLYRLKDGLAVEGVLIPEETRHTLCISTQVGCPGGCVFCHTARMGYLRQLTRDEIVGQVLAARTCTDRAVTNLVFMGMGEPLLNRDAVFDSIRVLVADEGLRFSKRHITVSTAGITPAISDLAEGVFRGIGLAVSLNAPTDALRSRLMPLNRKYPLRDLVEACSRHARKIRRRITFEYVLIAGVNDRSRDRNALVKLLHGIPCKINLIPFNPFPGTQFETPLREKIDEFQEYLFRSLRRTIIVRESRGIDIGGACGQLASIAGIDSQTLSASKTHN